MISTKIKLKNKYIWKRKVSKCIFIEQNDNKACKTNDTPSHIVDKFTQIVSAPTYTTFDMHTINP